MFVQLFGYGLAAGVLLSSLVMIVMGGRFQRVEVSAYGSAHRPWWFWAISLVLAALYGLALGDFITSEKTWAGWLLIVIIPLGWAIKGGLVTFDQRGRE